MTLIEWILFLLFVVPLAVFVAGFAIGVCYLQVKDAEREYGGGK